MPTDPTEAKPKAGKERAGSQRVTEISTATAQIVHEAGALLDEEMAAGILAAKRMQERFEAERRLEPADFKEALLRFQSDGHAVVNLLNDQLVELRTDESAALATRLVGNVHNLLDLAVGFVTLGSDVANQLIQANLPKTATSNEGEAPTKG